MALNTKRNRTEPGEINHISDPSFSDLPRDIMVNVLLRLSLKRIFVSKLVCKTWHDLISEPEFAKLHFDRAQACPLIQVSDYTVRSRMLYLVQPDEKDFELKFEMCDHSKYKSECDCLVKFELDTKFKLPFRNVQMIFDDKDSVRYTVDHVSGGESNSRFKMRMYYHKYHVVNSCNGLLCLSSPSNHEPRVVCNPVTEEFINLPEVKRDDLCGVMHCGLGFSPATNQYKVVRMFPPSDRNAKFIDSGIGAKVHTLGTETWKDIEFSSRAICLLHPTYLNGFLYWPCSTYRALPLCLVSFDVANECFASISAPPMNSSNFDVKMGVLGGEICISCFYGSGLVEFWVLKDYGTRNEWSNVFSINSYCCDTGFCFGPCQPIKYLNDGALLMFSSSTNSLTYKHPQYPRFRHFKFVGESVRLEVTAHVPSFISLKEALSGHNVKVHKPRFRELKLKNEDKGISIQETGVVSPLSVNLGPKSYEIISRHFVDYEVIDRRWRV